MSARDVLVTVRNIGARSDDYLRGFEEGIQAYKDALHAAGFAVVPVEPTREMWAASGNALVNGRVKLKAHHDYLSETVWTAMIAAANPDSTPDKPPA
jgi:hypothetical protein